MSAGSKWEEEFKITDGPASGAVPPAEIRNEAVCVDNDETITETLCNLRSNSLLSFLFSNNVVVCLIQSYRLSLATYRIYYTPLIFHIPKFCVSHGEI